MISIRNLEQYKLYEDQDGIVSYLERAIRKLINMFERAYCRNLDIKSINREKMTCADSVIISMTTFPARMIMYIWQSDHS